MEYTYETVMDQLSALSDGKRIAFNRKHGVTGEQFGILLGPLRALAKQIKRDHALAVKLWNSKNYDAMILGAMLLDPNAITEEDFDALLAEAYLPALVDELTFGVLGESKLAAGFMNTWRMSDEDLRGRAGWNLAINFVEQHALAENVLALLMSEVESKLVSAPPNKQWAMNRCLCTIGILNDDWTELCLAVGEKLGVYRDMKVSKGCTSAYAPEWIRVGRAKRNG